MLSGLLGGLPFNGKLSTRTQIWTSISTSPATKRQRNLFHRTTLKSLVLLPWPIPHLRRPFLLPTFELLCLCFPDVGFICLSIYTFLSSLGPETCVVPLIYTYLLSLYFFFSFFICRLRSHGSIVAFLHELCGPD